MTQMNVLIVYAHPEPQSFNAAVLARTCQTLTTLGHTCVVRDLYRMAFNPLTTGADFITRNNPGVLHYDKEQKVASKNGGYDPALRAEIEHLLWTDAVILQFPLYWFSVPAIMKGWIDRVFVDGIAYGDGRWYDKGALKGKRAMISMTTGCYPTMCGRDGINGNLDVMLWPLQNGTLRFVGFDVLAPFVAWSVAHKDAPARARDLERLDVRLSTLATDPPLRFNGRSDFDSDWRLKPGIAPLAAGQQVTVSPSHDANT
jgi:NAD(P)H dehydrogenase (quinone)